MRPYTRPEERDVAAGRADVSVTRSHRFVVRGSAQFASIVIEVKRELSDSSRAALHVAHGGQAAAYSAGGPRVSVALVLDLTSHSDGVPIVGELGLV